MNDAILARNDEVHLAGFESAMSLTGILTYCLALQQPALHMRQ